MRQGGEGGTRPEAPARCLPKADDMYCARDGEAPRDGTPTGEAHHKVRFWTSDHNEPIRFRDKGP